MKRIILMLTVAAFMVAVLSVSAVTAFAAKACTPGAPGCDTETTNKKDAGASPGFNETETQRGQTHAKGTEDTETTVCTGPSGKTLSPDHPQCQ